MENAARLAKIEAIQILLNSPRTTPAERTALQQQLQQLAGLQHPSPAQPETVRKTTDEELLAELNQMIQDVAAEV